MSTLKNIKLTNLLGSVCSIMLLALAFLIITPPAIDSANADTRATVRANVTPVMSIALDNSNIDINLTPSTSGAYNAGSSKLTVNTNNATGYQLYMQTSSGEATLVSKNDQKILPMAGSELTDNTWGYSLGSGFAAVPATETSIMNKASSGVDTYDLSFGVKVNSTIPSGTYTNEVILSAVANPTTLTDMMDLFYMQDMTSTLCANTQGTDGNAVSASLHNEPSKQLIDIRDGKVYWVSKLADGNCWMTQNLAYDITEDRIKNNEINPSNTDVSEVWNESSAYPPIETKINNVFSLYEADSNQYNETYSWNLGKFVLATSELGAVCSSSSPDESIEDDGHNPIRLGQTFAQCQNLVDVASANWTPTYMATNGNWAAPNSKNQYKVDEPSGELIETVVAVKCNLQKTDGTCDADAGGEYDPHYSLGNYYQWNAVTAGSGGMVIGQRASSSICPKGWGLPGSDNGVARNAQEIAGISDYNTKYGQTFTKLLANYGFEFPNGAAPDITGNTEQGNYDIAANPFYFVRAGSIGLTTKSLRDTGMGATYWADMGIDSSKARLMFFTNRYVSPSNGYFRWAGIPVRCVAR